MAREVETDRDHFEYYLEDIRRLRRCRQRPTWVIDNNPHTERCPANRLYTLAPESATPSNDPHTFYRFDRRLVPPGAHLFSLELGDDGGDDSVLRTIAVTY